MIWARITFSLCVVLAWFSLSPVQAEGVSTQVVQTLQARDQTLSHLTFSWQRAAKEQVFCSLSATELAAIKKKMKVGSEADYRRRGITDEARIKRDVQITTQNVMTALRGGSVAYTNVWSFQRDGSATLARGTTQQFNGFIGTFRQFYDRDAAMSVVDEAHFVDGPVLSRPNPFAWRTSGESISYPVSSSDNLDLSPEHLAFLLGSNPLALRGLAWKLQSQSPASLVLKSGFVVEHTIYNIRMALSVKNGFAPSEVVIQSGNDVQRFTTSSFRRYKDTWVSDRVEYIKDTPGFVHEAQVWKLQTLTPSSPIELKIAGNEPVRDFRLLGSDLSPQTLNKAGMRQDKRFGKIVYYSWPGHFPSEEELKKIFQKQHPGESMPDPGKTSSALPFIGGMFCLVGGVWMSKRRGMA